MIRFRLSRETLLPVKSSQGLDILLQQTVAEGIMKIRFGSRVRTTFSIGWIQL